MQTLQPLGVAYIGLAAWHVLGITSVVHDELKATIEYLEDRNPLDPCGLHRDRAHATLREPVRQPMQIAGEGSQTAHRLGKLVGPDCGYMHRRPDVDCSSIQVSRGNIPLAVTSLYQTWLALLFSCRLERLGCAKDSNS